MLSAIPAYSCVSKRVFGGVIPVTLSTRGSLDRPVNVSRFDSTQERVETVLSDVPSGPPQQQRQQGVYHAQDPSVVSSSRSTQSLRRVPKLDETQTSRPRSTSETEPRYSTVRFIDDPARPSSVARHRRVISTGARDVETPAHPALQISRRTASAIRFALEEALRSPNTFAPVLEEENASMSDLTSGSAGIGRSANGGARAAAGPVPVGQQSARSGVRTPRDIMRQREERVRQQEIEAEEKRKAQQQEARRESAERRYTAAGVAAPPPRDSGYRSQGMSSGGRTPGEPSYQTPLPSTGSYAGEQTTETYSRRQEYRPVQQPVEYPPSRTSQTAPRAAYQQQPQPGTSSQQYQQRQQQTSQSQSQTQQQQQPSYAEASGQQSRSRGEQSSRRQPSQDQRGPPPVIGSSDTRAKDPNTNSYPHAFERWEMLSSYWEGTTSSWIRRLEQNTRDLSDETSAISAQQSLRQITDLATAGANLFHAVVELQRLRASSERKFQRWFLDTRAQQEREQEEKARLRNELEAVRQQKTGMTRQELDKRQAEMRRELQISKDEARRAWEELGRREQQDRELAIILREGQPVVVGGVQVVPTQAAMSRGPSLAQRGGPPGGISIPSAAQGLQEQYPYHPQDASPTDTDPFTERPRQQMPPVSRGASSGIPTYPTVSRSQPQSRTPPGPSTQQPPSSEPFYRQPDTYLHDPGVGSSSAQRPTQSRRQPDLASKESDDALELEDDAYHQSLYEYDSLGRLRLDSAGQPIRRQPIGGSGRGAGPSQARRNGNGNGHAVENRLSLEDLHESGDEGDVTMELAREREEAQAIRRGQVPSSNVAASISRVPVPTSTSSGNGNGNGNGASTRRAYPTNDPSNYVAEGRAAADPLEEAAGAHHHPTRLSDVPEEESQSRASSGGRGSMF